MVSTLLRVLTWVDILLGLGLFFLLSDVVPAWSVFGISGQAWGTRAFMFVVAVLLLANGVFFTLARTVFLGRALGGRAE